MLKVAVLVNIMDGDDMSSSCMEECQKQIDAISAEGKYSFSIYLNDLGQSGFLAVCEKAANDSPDFYLWVCHDLSLSDGAIRCLLENSEFLRHKAVITGTVCSRSKELMFGGRSRRGRLLDPDPIIPVPCNLYDLALALVPSYAVSKVSSISDIFHEGFFDYGMGTKVIKAGVARVIAPGILARTPRTYSVPAWQDSSKPLSLRAKSLLKVGNRELFRVLHSIFR